jgi:hypothetical protein
MAIQFGKSGDGSPFKVTVAAVEVAVALVCDRSGCVSIGESKVIAGG